MTVHFPQEAESFQAQAALSPIVWAQPERQAAFDQWLASVAPQYGLRPDSLCSASSDASFRRYFRIHGDAVTFIIMDAPPPEENVRPFLDMAQKIKRAGLNAPEVLAADENQGFLLLTDLGSRLYLAALEQATPDEASMLMRQAIEALVQWQVRLSPQGLPDYNHALLHRELELFPEWCVGREYGRQWSAAEQAVWQQVCGALVASALAQATVVVHRDYMPRNLMVTSLSSEACRVWGVESENQPQQGRFLPGDTLPGILDFQDAVRGPISYDVASLIRDAFISWNEEQELDFAVRYWQAACAAQLPVGPDFGEFWRALEWMGLQRHLKVLGIFCRLKHRDAKPKYSQDLPRFFSYAHKVATRYATLRPLCLLLEPLMGESRHAAYY
ncbi:MAG: aminoglycoside phosphotransferase family protein [Burkholderiales bacterium]|jgi:aminoglycoside/choline kinase family phosphotransferase